MLSYTLAPHGTYPHQLRQAVELLRYTITFLHRNPANITLGGDSAGANLAIGVLSHLLHPHPEIERLDLRQLVEGGKEPKLGAAILLAPWVSFSNDWPSTQKNRYKDLVSPVVGDLWWMSFLGGRPRDAYNEPLAAEEGWWNRLEGVVKEVLIVGGGDEILIDSIKELARRYEVSSFSARFLGSFGFLVICLVWMVGFIDMS